MFPARSQGRGSPPAASWPLWTCAAISDAGDVLTSVERPNPASLVGLTPGGGCRLDGRNGQPWKTERLFGAAFAAADPTVPNRPASGAGIPPKASQGEEVCRLFREVCA